MTGVGGLCWYEGDFWPKLDQVVNLPGLSKLRSKRPHEDGDAEVSAKKSYDPHNIISLLSPSLLSDAKKERKESNDALF